MMKSPVPAPDQPRLVRRSLLRLAAQPALLAAAGCASPTTPIARAVATSDTTFPPGSDSATVAQQTAFGDDSIRAGIQDTLNRQVAARAQADRDAFQSTVDQRNLTWRRIQGDVFTAEAARGPHPVGVHTVTRVQPKQNGYVKAWIDIESASRPGVVGQAVWVYRPAGPADPASVGWLHSEILNEEIGSRKSLETEHFLLAYFAWDDDVIDRIAVVAEQAHARVAGRTGLAPDLRSALSVNPTYGAHSALRGYGTWALFMPGTDLVLMRSIESYGAGTTGPGETQDERLLIALTHEYAHLANNRLVSTVKMPKWMVEGFAEYVAENLRAGAMLSALRSGRTVTLDKASEIIEWGVDPSRGYTSADIDLAYAHAAHAVSYFMERFGQSAFITLAAAFADSRRWEESLLTATGITGADLEREWLEWTRRRYGV